MNEFTAGDRALLVGLVKRDDLNGRRGTVTVVTDDRVALVVDGRGGEGVLVKPTNLDKAKAAIHDDAQRRRLIQEVSVLDTNATAAGRINMLEDVLAQARRVRGLPVVKYGHTPEERVAFWEDFHNLAGVRPDFESV
jgi:hypothetical protein